MLCSPLLVNVALNIPTRRRSSRRRRRRRATSTSRRRDVFASEAAFCPRLTPTKAVSRPNVGRSCSFYEAVSSLCSHYGEEVIPPPAPRSADNERSTPSPHGHCHHKKSRFLICHVMICYRCRNASLWSWVAGDLAEVLHLNAATFTRLTFHGLIIIITCDAGSHRK